MGYCYAGFTLETHASMHPACRLHTPAYAGYIPALYERHAGCIWKNTSCTWKMWSTCFTGPV